MILKFRNFLQVKSFNENQLQESDYFIEKINESEDYAPRDPRLREFWESRKTLREKQVARIKKCVTMVVGKYPFFGDFLQTSRFVWDHPSVPTMATDGVNIFISSEFCSRHTEQQLVFVLVHEVMHITLLHHFRMKEHGVKNGQKWNIAADYEINPYCAGLGIITPAEIKAMDGLYNEDYLNMPVEMIYDKLPDQKSQNQQKPPPPPPPPPKEPSVGDYVRINSDKSLGKIVGKNPDGTWEIEEVTREEVSQAMRS